jgi:DMSO/TMAO reductase YedYZ molybdopterin-dependent catalytic subunit
MLAYEMNGEDLPRDHGYPVRMLIPGHVGARQVKWLHKINLSNEESTKSYQCKSYRHFAPDITFEKGERFLGHWPLAKRSTVYVHTIPSLLLQTLPIGLQSALIKVQSFMSNL